MSSQGKWAVPVLTTLLLVLSALLVMFPFFLMVVTSLKPPQEIFQVGSHLLPRKPTLSNYATVFGESQLLRYLLNGLIVTSGVLTGQLLVTIPAGYAFAKMSFPGRGALFTLVLAALVFPKYIAAVPNFLFLSKAGLINT